ncbi:cysteine desulfurase [Bradyrhizobium sp. S3.9.2]|uniref:cysteine desulfurase family protein n=1 Tax=Bradyrhizobium sp. S3.9.2 TaxID=3156432 RepID=UPI0033929F7E
MPRSIYLDYQATTPTDPLVMASMVDHLDRENVGNSHSEHFAGRKAAAAVDVARLSVADLIGAEAEEIIFTSGATEANNIAIQGIARAAPPNRRHFVTSAVEHKCVLETFEFLRRQGFEIDIVPVNRNGLIDLNALDSVVSDRTALVSIMAANNEIGSIQPLEKISRICRDRGAVFHTDAAQAAGKIPFDVRSAGADLVSISGHKIYAPIGIGALFVSDETPVRPLPLFHGGGQERGLRSGTLPVHLAVAIGVAAKLAIEALERDAEHSSKLRAAFVETVRRKMPFIRINAEAAPRIPGNLSITIPGVDADRLVGALQPDLAISTNAACSSGVMEPSHVLLAIGLSREEAESTVRVGFGRFNSLEEVTIAANLLATRIEQIDLDRPGASRPAAVVGA